MRLLAAAGEADPTALWQPEPLRARLAEVLTLLEDRLWDFIGVLPLLVVALLVFAAFVLLARLAGRMEWPYRWLSRNVFLRELSRHATRVGFVLVGALVALEILEATALVGAVLGTAGLVGLAVGFALREGNHVRIPKPRSSPTCSRSTVRRSSNAADMASIGYSRQSSTSPPWPISTAPGKTRRCQGSRRSTAKASQVGESHCGMIAGS